MSHLTKNSVLSEYGFKDIAKQLKNSTAANSFSLFRMEAINDFYFTYTLIWPKQFVYLI